MKILGMIPDKKVPELYNRLNFSFFLLNRKGLVYLFWKVLGA